MDLFQGLDGTGCFAAVIDSGIDYAHPAFRYANGRTRIFALWDQTISGKPPEGYARGSLYTRDMIDKALGYDGEGGDFSREEVRGEDVLEISPTREREDRGNAKDGVAWPVISLTERRRIVPSFDATGHGTAIAGLLGASIVENAPMSGAASNSEFLIVKLGNEVDVEQEGLRVSEQQVIEAVEFVLGIANRENRPVGINLSFGTHRGAHNGAGPLALYLNQVQSTNRCVICIGTGNEGNTSHHASGMVSWKKQEGIEFSWLLQALDSVLQVSLWSYAPDCIEVELVSPTYEIVGRGKINCLSIGRLDEVRTDSSNQSENLMADTSSVRMVEIYPTPLNSQTELRITFRGAQVGVWNLRLRPIRIVNGGVDLWMTSGGKAVKSRFLKPDVERTLTSPSDASLPVSVGAYDERTGNMAPFSGRGNTRGDVIRKPDLVAPGVDLWAPVPNGGYARKSGTSMATPLVTARSILWMQWGIVLKNDEQMFGQKVKARLIALAEQLKGEKESPNPRSGWGRIK